MKKVALYMNETADKFVNSAAVSRMEKYCADHNYEIAALLGEDTDGSGMSMPMRYSFIGMDQVEGIDAILTFCDRMIGNTDEEVEAVLRMFDDYDIQVESCREDMLVHYNNIFGYETETENDVCQECQAEYYRKHIVEEIVADAKE